MPFNSAKTILHSVKHRFGNVRIATFLDRFLNHLTFTSYMAFQFGNVPIGLSLRHPAHHPRCVRLHDGHGQEARAPHPPS